MEKEPGMVGRGGGCDARRAEGHDKGVGDSCASRDGGDSIRLGGGEDWEERGTPLSPSRGKACRRRGAREYCVGQGFCGGCDIS